MEGSRKAVTTGASLRSPFYGAHIRLDLVERATNTTSHSCCQRQHLSKAIFLGPPEGVHVKARGSEALEVFWLPPLAHLQHGRIKGYYVGYRRAEPTSAYKYETVQVSGDNVETPMSLLIQGLSKFTKYTVTLQVLANQSSPNITELLVQAFNQVGTGPKNSPEVLVSTAEDVPSLAPSSLTCSSPSPTSLALSWQPPPPEAMHGLLKGFTVYYRAMKEWEVGLVRTEATMSKGITLTGLQPYQNYTLQVSTH